MKTLLLDLRENTGVLCKGAIGISSSAAGSWISTLSEVEAYLRILSLLIGGAVGLVTIWSILRHRNDKNK